MKRTDDMKKIASTVIGAVMAIGVLAAPVPYYYIASGANGYTTVLNASGSNLAVGSVVRVGNFSNAIDLATLAVGGITPAELAQINGAWEDFLTFQIGDDDYSAGLGAGEFGVTGSAEGAAHDEEQAFMLVYNVSALGSVDLATEFGLLQFNLNFPNDDDAFPATHDTGVAAGLDTLIAGYGSFVDGGFQMVSVIPEPGTWAAMAATVLGLAFWRARRKRS